MCLQYGLDAPRFVRQKLGLPLDARQAEVLASPVKRGLLNCTRQWGKSTVTAAMAVHRACFAAESLTPDREQSCVHLMRVKRDSRGATGLAELSAERRKRDPEARKSQKLRELFEARSDIDRQHHELVMRLEAELNGKQTMEGPLDFAMVFGLAAKRWPMNINAKIEQ